MVVRTAFQRWLLATVLVLTILAGACASANATPPSVGLESATPLATQTLRVSAERTLGVLTATPSATQEPIATQTPRVLATPVPESEIPLPTSDPTLVVGLIGLWQGDNGSFYLFNNDGTWNWDKKRAAVETGPENQGRWWLEGDVFNIQDLTGIGACPRDQIGTYQVHVAADTLTLTRLTELCLDRSVQTDGQYTRLPAGP
jgi:hypothetical protein